MTDRERGAEGRYRAIFESAVDFAIIASDTEGQITDYDLSGQMQVLADAGCAPIVEAQ